MIAIMTEFCDIYTRLWCVYEIFVAVLLNIPVTLESYNEITGYGGTDRMYSNVVLDSTGMQVNTIKASCGYERDKQMIHREILKLDGGFALLDDVIMWVRIMSLINDMPKCEEREVAESHWSLTLPIGSCSISNMAARQNAAIANALRVWQKAKYDRRMSEIVQVPSVISASVAGTTTSIPVERSIDSDEPFGFFSLMRDKLCGVSYSTV